MAPVPRSLGWRRVRRAPTAAGGVPAAPVVVEPRVADGSHAPRQRWSVAHDRRAADGADVPARRRRRRPAAGPGLLPAPLAGARRGGHHAPRVGLVPGCRPALDPGRSSRSPPGAAGRRSSADLPAQPGHGDVLRRGCRRPRRATRSGSTFSTNIVFISAILAWGMYIGSRRELLWTLRARAERAESEHDLRATSRAWRSAAGSRGRCTTCWPTASHRSPCGPGP